MMNPFKKRQRKQSVTSTLDNTTSRLIHYGRAAPPKSTGIVIAAAAATESPLPADQPKLDLDHVLPPASDYRQSLIMPHLTRRFELLRAPDGSLISPDAMRAHLRAQRARARAASSSSPNLASDQTQPHFLTEEEENEIIEQLKLQALVEGRDFSADESHSLHQSSDSWRDGYSAGTDGFGSYGPPTQSHPGSLLDLTESLGHLSSNETIQADHTPVRPPREANSAAQKGRQSTADDDRNELTPQQGARTGTQSLSKFQEPLMPGDFRAAEKRASLSGPSTPTVTSYLDVPLSGTFAASRPSQDSTLLTSLTPEAFKRISTALEEVYQLHTNTEMPSDTSARLTPNGGATKAARSSMESDAISFTSALSDVNGLGLSSEAGNRGNTSPLRPARPADLVSAFDTAPTADATSSVQSLPTNDSMQTLKGFSADRPTDAFASQVSSSISSASTLAGARHASESEHNHFAQRLGSPKTVPTLASDTQSPTSITSALPRNGMHSRKDSADVLATARSQATLLREQPTPSRANYRPHARDNTASSDGSAYGNTASPRTSGLPSTPGLTRSARSPSYFPRPSSGVPQDYASGFKPPSAISPAATAALQTMSGRNSISSSNHVYDASNALQSAQRLRDSSSTNRSQPSPQMNNMSTFSPFFERPAYTSSPGTSISHRRTASSSSNNRTSDNITKYSHQMSNLEALPETSRSTDNGSTAEPFQHTNGWRSIYGTNPSESAGGLFDKALSPQLRDLDGADTDDLWAHMAQASADPRAASERPVSNFPPGLAEDHLAGAGITIDQLANFQDLLIQTASNDTVPTRQDMLSATAGQSKFAAAKSKGLASPNMVQGSQWGEPSDQPVLNSIFDGKEPLNVRDRSAMTSPTSPNPRDGMASPRAVMYDVTTSHRPSSVSLHGRNGSFSALPSLYQLASPSGQKRESVSLSQAVGLAADNVDQQSNQQHTITTEHDTQSLEELMNAREFPDDATSVQTHPFNAGYTISGANRTTEHPYGRFETGQPRNDALAGGSRRPSQASQQLSAGTERFHEENASLSDMLHYPDPAQLLGNVEIQARAATRALKGVDDGSVATPPVRSKSMSRKKSLKKIAQHISSPQLISTSQKLDSATKIPSPPAVPTDYGSLSNRTPKKIKSPGNTGGMFGSVGARRGSTNTGPIDGKTIRRRSSSFGHEVGTSDGIGLAQGGVDATPSQPVRSASTRQSPSTANASNHPYMNGSTASASLSRFFSKMKNKKANDDSYGALTIDPFPSRVVDKSAFSPKSPRSPHSKQANRPPISPEFEMASPRGYGGAAPLLSEDAPDTADSSLISNTSRGSISGSATTSSYNDQSSSGRSLRSGPIYTLPIDSTTMPRSRSKKRTPIVLKRESEVIMPGDPGYIPFAIISKQPEKAEAAPAVAETPLASITSEQAASDRSTDKLEKTSREAEAKNDDSSLSGSWMADASAAAAIADTSSSLPDIAADELDVPTKSKNVGVTSSQPASAPAEVKSFGEDSSGPLLGQKSLRDTIVRRTIIIPTEVDFENLKARSASLLSSGVGQGRKNRRFVPSQSDALPLSPSVSLFASEPTGASQGETRPTRDTQQLITAAEILAKPTTDADAEPEGLPSLSSQKSLRPEWTPDTTRSNRTSRAESSYAGSLYDMYIGPEAPNASYSHNDPAAHAVPSDGLNNALSLSNHESGAPNAKANRASRMPTRHIEVTERADGSVVWQVIAGLADRSSVYSEYSARHSDYGDYGLDSTSSSFGGKSLANQTGDLPTRNEAIMNPVLANEDSRALFTKRQPKPIGELPELLHEGAPAEAADEDALPRTPDPELSMIDEDSHAAQNDHPTDSHTRIVYHNDAQLASLLEVLAQGKDSAKFELQFSPIHPALGEHSFDFPRSTSDDSTGLSSASGFVPYADDQSAIDEHRSRVEAEIYTLLNQNSSLVQH